jgi:NADH-quinone oxidoreductase subunit H
MRFVAMTISYEVPLVLVLLSAVLLSGTMSLQGMVFWAKEYHWWIGLTQPIALVIYFICVSAELNRTPTDIAEAESEIVAGYLTEYSGMQWGLFYGMDIGYALAAAAFASTVFLGGWSLFGLDQWIPPWMIIIGKTHLFYFIFIWTRGTLPRLRIDQLMSFAWKFLLPVALLNLLVIATERQIWNEIQSSAGDNAFWFVYVLTIVNVAFAAAAVYGWARFLGYRPEKQVTRPRIMNEASGYVPVAGTAKGGS